MPGRLSVSRTIGDIESKYGNFGGNPNVIICEPDIFIYDLKKIKLIFLFRFVMEYLIKWVMMKLLNVFGWY